MRPDRAFTDAGRRHHHRRSPVGHFAGRIGQRHRPLGHFWTQGRDARRAGLVAEKAINAFFHEAFLPASDAGLRLARPTHNLRCADTVGAQEDDCRPPHMFLGGIVVPNHRVKSTAIGETGCEGYSSAHAQDPHMRPAMGIPNWTRPLGGNH